MSEFPKLLWLPDGREVTAHDADEQDRLVEAGARFTVEPTTDVVALDKEDVGSLDDFVEDAFDASPVEAEELEEAEDSKPKKKGKK